MSTTNKTPKFSAGKKVNVTRRGQTVTGRYVGSETKVNGTWHQVNVAAPRQPAQIVSVRGANLTRA